MDCKNRLIMHEKVIKKEEPFSDNSDSYITDSSQMVKENQIDCFVKAEPSLKEEIDKSEDIVKTELDIDLEVSECLEEEMKIQWKSEGGEGDSSVAANSTERRQYDYDHTNEGSLKGQQQFLVDGSQSLLSFPDGSTETYTAEIPEPEPVPIPIPITQNRQQEKVPEVDVMDTNAAIRDEDDNPPATILNKITDPEVLTEERPLERTHQCDICFKNFAKKQYLTKHKYRHRPIKPHICELCGKSFAQKFEVAVHKIKHTGAKPYQCNYCQKKFRSKINLANHKMHHTGEYPYWCSVCNKRLSTQLRLEKHVTLHTGTVAYKCDYCPKGYALRISLEKHLIQAHKIELKDFTVPGDFDRNGTINQMETMEAISNMHRIEEEKTTLIATMMGKGAIKQDVVHMDHVGRVDIPSMDGELDVPFSIPVKQEYLKTCLLETSHDVDDATRFFTIFHSQTDSTSEPCLKEEIDELEDIVKTELDIDLEESECLEEEMKIQWKSEVDSSVAGNSTERRQYNYDHTNEGNLKGQQHFLVDGSQSLLSFPDGATKIYTAEIPEPEPVPFPIPITQNSQQEIVPGVDMMDTNASIRDEDDNPPTTILNKITDPEVLTEERPFERTHQCDICFKNFAKKQYLTKHKYRHRPIKPHICKLCGKGFAQKFEVAVHKIKHTGAKPYKCNYCQKEFRSKINLANHKIRHTGEYPYVCSVCNKGLSTQLRLEKHVSLHLPNIVVKALCRNLK